MKKIFVITILIFFSNAFSQSSWYWMNPIPQGNTINNLQMISPTLCFAVGNQGTFLKSTNAGMSWIIKNTNITQNIEALTFINESTGYVLAYDGIILKTTNGGDNWITRNTGYFAKPYDIKFINESTGFAGCECDYLLKTTNGGLNWYLNCPNAQSHNGFTSISFLDNNTGYVYSPDYLFKTTNTGLTWDSVYSPYKLSNHSNNFKSFSDFKYKINLQNSNAFGDRTYAHFFDVNFGIIAGYNRFLVVTTNGGLTWTDIDFINMSTCFYKTKYYNKDTVFIAGEQNNIPDIFISTNSGFNWSTYCPVGGTNDILGFDFNNYRTALIAGEYGMQGRSLDLCQNFTFTTNYITWNLISVSFPDSLHGFAISGKSLLKTTNGGMSWSKYDYHTQNTSTGEVSFIDSLHGVIALPNSTNSGYTFYTSNGGNTFTRTSFASQRNSAFLIDVNTGWSAGSAGSIYKTTNGGLSWFSQSSGVTDDLNSVHFFNNNTGMACGINGRILKTTNGGANWIQLTSNITNSLDCIRMCDSMIAYTCGNYGKILKTANGGVNWITQNVPGVASSWTFTDISAVNTYLVEIVGVENNGGVNLLFQTTNGGADWNRQTTVTNNALYAVKLFNPMKIIAAGAGGSIVSTINGGYLEVPVPNPYYPYNNMINVSTRPTFLWAASSNAVNYQMQISLYSDFSSITFDTVSGLTTQIIIPACNILTRNNQYYWRVRASNPSYTSAWSSVKTFNTNIPNFWYQQFPFVSNNINSISMLDSHYGYAVGDSGRILATNSSGDCWYKLNVFTNLNLNSVKFINYSTGYVISDSGNIYKSTNSGFNWYSLISPVNLKLNKLTFLNELTGYITGNSGIIIKTTNSGINWNLQNSNTTNDLNSLFSVNADILWVVGKNGTILFTSNGGNDWLLKPSPSANFNAAFFLNDSSGWVCGENGILITTTNAGNSWISKNLSSNINLYSITFTSNQRGWCVGNNGKIIASTDAGITWLIQPDYLNLYDFKEVFFTDVNKGWCVGTNGIIYHTENGLTVINDLNNVKEHIPSDFSLSQNYPNPFNPSTNIKYQIINNKLVILKIYDILGKEIETLVNEKQSPGTYEVTWNADKYPSGVYFYKIISENYSETRKMILLK